MFKLRKRDHQADNHKASSSHISKPVVAAQTPVVETVVNRVVDRSGNTTTITTTTTTTKTTTFPEQPCYVPNNSGVPIAKTTVSVGSRSPKTIPSVTWSPSKATKNTYSSDEDSDTAGKFESISVSETYRTYEPNVVQAVVIIQSHYRRRKAQRQYQKLKKNQKLRDSILQEIVATERVYVKNLSLIIECFMRPLNPINPNIKEGEVPKKKGATIGAASAPPPHLLLKEKEYKAIFSQTLEIIFLYNQELLSQLETKLLKWGPLETIGDTFLKMTQFLKVYTNYVKGYSEALQMLEKVLQHNYHFENYVRDVFRQELKREEGEKLESSLSSLLVTPIQRLPRYVLLLDQMDQATDADHPDKAYLAKALATMRLVATHVNDQQKELERQEKMLRMQSSLYGTTFNESFLSAHRKFYREGYLTLLKMKANSSTSSMSSGSSSISSSHNAVGSISASQSCIKKKVYYCFLLSDMIIFSKPPSHHRRRSTMIPPAEAAHHMAQNPRNSLSRAMAAALNANKGEISNMANQMHGGSTIVGHSNGRTVKYKYVRKYHLCNFEVTNLSESASFLGPHVFEVKMPGHGLLLLSTDTEEEFDGWLKDLHEISVEAQKKRETETVAVAAAVASAKKKSLRGWLHNSHSHQPSAIALVQAAGMNGSSTSQVLANSLARQTSRRSTRRKISDIFPGVEKEAETCWQ